MYVTALGVYEAVLNGLRISEYVLAPGWTAYEKRLQYQCYDITELMGEENHLEITVGKGWFSSPMPGWVDSEDKIRRQNRPLGILAELHIIYDEDTEIVLSTDESWEWAESAIRFSEIYDGEMYDASYSICGWKKAQIFDWPVDILIPQEGEEIREMERLEAKSVFTTPAGEIVVDFGQEVTGYVEFTVNGKKGEHMRILHGEVLDRAGNFYNENYRSAKAELNYICRDGVQTWHPHLTFFGFRYLKLAEFPETPKPEQFTAIAVYSNIHRTGMLRSGVPELNQLFSNIFWGQKGNFLDVPTDCPQRDERLGWTGDAQVFVKTASYNYDVEKFFRKWLRDMEADQRENGAVGQVIPDYMPEGEPSAAWGDAATICPWQIYLTYGNKEVLVEQLYENIVRRFRNTYPDYRTQTEHVLTVQFGLSENPQKTADALADMVRRDGMQMCTGFVGTPYILHVLSEYGHSDLAYDLLLRREYPSWLYSVKAGATTIWEHWDGIMENGEFWSADMNSFNHYAYGAVADWVYEKAAGITLLEKYPGFEKVLVRPVTDARLGWLEASIETRHGHITTKWTYTSDGIRYEIDTAVPAIIEIGEKKMEMEPGVYTFWR